MSVRLRLGIGRCTPSESTFRRVLQTVDPDELDRSLTRWLARRSAAAVHTAAGAGPDNGNVISGSGGGSPVVRAIAVDGKTARGARPDDDGPAP